MDVEKNAEDGEFSSSKEALHESEKKWGAELLKAGWTMLPNMLFLRQRALGLDSLDINILLVLLSHWWHADNLPFPTKQTIANAIGCDSSTVRRRIQKMEAGGLLRRIERRMERDRNKSNQYDFSGLKKALEPFAKEELQVRDQERAERANRLKKKGKPKLKAVPSKQ